jgi:hypothetical protein
MTRHRCLCHSTIDFGLERMFRKTGARNRVKDIQGWHDLDRDYAMTHFFKVVCHAPQYPVYDGRANFAAFLASESPKL